MKYMKYLDALKYNKKNLDEVAEELKKVSTGYQNYLQANPFKQKRKDLAGKKEKIIARIFEIINQGIEHYDGR